MTDWKINKQHNRVRITNGEHWVATMDGVDKLSDAELITKAVNNHDALIAALNAINERIYAQGAALGSDDYFFIRKTATVAVANAVGVS